MNGKFIQNLCRLCATHDIDHDKLENGSSNNCSTRERLISLVGKYLHIKVNDDQTLPQKFCSGCCEQLYSFDIFAQRCHNLQEVFHKIVHGIYLNDDQKQLIHGSDFANQLQFSIITNEQKFEECSPTVEYNPSQDEPSWDDDVKSEIDIMEDDEVPLAFRTRGACIAAEQAEQSTPNKRRRGRPKKDPTQKVPPLRIKAVKRRTAVASYEIEDKRKNGCDEEAKNFEIKTEDELKTEDDELEDPTFWEDDFFEDDDYLASIDQKTKKGRKKNPFTLFEFKCNDCNQVFKNFSNLKRHCKKEHSKPAAVKCVCGKLLRARTAIIEHRRKHTGTSLYKCDSCTKTFNRRSLLCLHMISHMPKEEQPYVCCKCAKRFHTSSLLKKHEKVHLPEEERFLDVCPICHKKFTSKSAVNAHLKAVHYGEKPFVCEHCGNSFSSKAILTDHLTTHSTYAPWPCSFCGKNFKSKYRLNVHKDMHRSVKYRCPHCPMELSTRRTLRMHLLVHKEEKAYVCKVCAKAFRRSKDLKNHSNLHTGRRPYKCEFCERTFANGSNCRAHKLRMHPTELGVEKNHRALCKKARAAAASVIEPPVIGEPSSITTSVITAMTSITDVANHHHGQHLHPTQVIDAQKEHCASSSKMKTFTMLNDVVRGGGACVDYAKYEPSANKYDYGASAHDLDYTLDYARYPTPLNLNLKKPNFMQPTNVNHLSGYGNTVEMHSDLSKVHHHFLSYS